jgi:hypothetical protein
VRSTLLLLTLLCSSQLTTAGAAEDLGSATAPHFLIDVEIVDRGNAEVLIAARLFFDRFEQSFHSDGQRDRPDLANRTQKLSILQSEIVQFSVNQLSFTTVQGKSLSIEDAKESLNGRPAVLFLPRGAALHPAIRAVLQPDAVIVSYPKGSRPENSTITRPILR